VKVLIIPDKFKGTLTARDAANEIASGWRSVRPYDALELLPMSDGGDGFGEIIGGMMGAEAVSVATLDSAHRPLEAKFWFHSPTQTAVIEAAQVNGLAILPPGQFHPFDLDTFGLGKVFESAIQLCARKALVGIGGSATNDGGFGLARALGWKFFADQNEIQRWTDLNQLTRVMPVPPRIDVTVAVDVQNPLLGPLGASRVYGPQKGLREDDMPKAEACLGRLAEIIGKGIAEEPGTGAAGGLGFGLKAFMNGRFISGSDLFCDAARLDERLKSADLLISGEGAIDLQSLMGKGVGSLFDRAKRAGVKRLGLAGALGPGVQEKFGNDPRLELMSIVPDLASIEEAKADAKRFLRELSSKAAQKYVV
jgi:glycerate 2-kinase